ncbi:MAG: methyl-accepting chemotaxis protein [Lachnospiraceae bacterium]|nr:methyl-accepting chemotaxis protein [Lachnospiraceae bacterium]
MKKEKGLSVSIKVKLLLIALLPSIVLGTILTIMASKSIEDGMHEEALQGLRAICFSLMEIYEDASPGEYYMDDEGNVYKGDMLISGSYDIVDHLSEGTGYEFTIFYGDTRITTSLTDYKTGERLVGTKAGEAVIEAVLRNGQEYSSIDTVINNAGYYAYYLPIVQNGQVIGMAFAGLPSAEGDAFIKSKEISLLVTSVVMLALMILIGTFFALQLSGALKGAQLFIGELAEGNLKAEINAKSVGRNDEVGLMCRQLVELKDELSEVVGKIKHSSQVLYDSGNSLEDMANQSSNTTNEIGHAVEDISSGAMNQAEETEAASASIGEIGNIITEIVGSVNSLNDTAENMKAASDASSVIIKELSDSNDKTTDAIVKIGRQVHATNDSVQAIRQAVDLITSIAEETNLLSLNASIEAARAGEHGRGFAVVATQIQKLAEESNQSAQEIGDIIDNLLKDSEQTVIVMDEVNVIVNEQRSKLEETKQKFNLVTDGVNTTKSEAEVIRGQANVCDDARIKIVDIIQNLSAISEENAASTQQTNASMQELNATLQILADSAKSLLELSEQLEKDMEFFKL